MLEVHDNPINHPATALIDLYGTYLRNGGAPENFAMIAGIDNDMQIIYTIAKKIGERVTFLTQKIKVPGNEMIVGLVRARIAETCRIIDAKKKTSDNGVNLGLNFIGNQ